MTAIAGVRLALGTAAIVSSEGGRKLMGDLGKLGLKPAENLLRNQPKCLKKAASYGAKKIWGGQHGGRLDVQKALATLGELHLRTLFGLKK